MMKKLFVTLCCLLIAAALCGGAMAATLDLQVPTLEDMLVQHYVLLADTGDAYEEYVTLFYTSGGHVLAQVNDETHFHKGVGITLDSLKSQNLDEFFPGYSSMSFADCLITDEGDYYSMLVRFKDLNTLVNMDQFQASGILPGKASDPLHDAEYVRDALVAGGMRELSMTEYGGLGLNFTVE